jgi:histidyl-tRNA synthetase
MNKLNDILKMISQMEKNAEEVKLGKHEVELSAINDLETLVNKSRSVEGEMVENYLDAKKFAQISITAAKNHLKNLESVYVLVNNIRTQGDALGVDVTKIQEWKRGADFLNGNPKASTQVMIKKLEGLK